MMGAGTSARIGLDAFENGTVDPTTFSHEAHVYVGWCLLQQYSMLEAIDRFTRALRALTKKAGLESKYHETISWFWMIVIAERREAAPSRDWSGFQNDNPDLFGNPGDLIRRSYSPGRLSSELARRTFLLPDRAP